MLSTVDGQRLELVTARGHAYAMLAHGWAYPDDGWRQVITEDARWKLWPETLIRSDSRFQEPLFELRKSVRRLSARNGYHDELLGAYSRLFGHAIRGACPPYELEYGASEIIQQASELADIAGFYEAFGLDQGNGCRERPDHITAELEFLGVLCAKEALGLNTGDGALTERSGDAERAFLKDHAARWLPAFCRRVESSDSDWFYGPLASFTAVFVAVECLRFEISAGPQWLELRPSDPNADAAIECDGLPNGADAAQAQSVPLTINGVPRRSA